MSKDTGRLADRIMDDMTIIYIIAPIIIFIFGWTKIIYSIVAFIIFGYFYIEMKKNLCNASGNLITRDTILFWSKIGIVVFLWVYVSGIGGFTFQNSDFWGRNPIYRDLCDYKWPVIYDLSQQSDYVKNITGDSTVAFSYYFAWWLAPALISKIFMLGEMGRSIVLFIWAILGVFLVAYNLYALVNKLTLKIITVFIFFSGLDVVGFYIIKNTIPFMEHIEWWSKNFQYSSNTTLLFWVFNQAIPVWLITVLLMRLDDNKNTVALSSLAFAYSPWATIGIVPIALYTVFQNKKIKKSITFTNISIPTIMIVFFGFFYAVSSGSSGKNGFIWELHPGEEKAVLIRYFMFILLEALIFFIVMGKKAKKYKFYYVILFELILLPGYQLIQYSFLLRGSIPALFILMVYIIMFFNESDESIKRRKEILIILLIIGAITPMTEMSRSLNKTANNSNESIVQESVYSFGAIKSMDENRIKTIKDQFFIYNYEDSFFFKFIAKN